MSELDGVGGWPALLPAEQYFQVGMVRTEFVGEVAAARAQFQARQAIHLKHVLEPNLMVKVMAMCESGGFVQEEPGSGQSDVEYPQRVGRLLDVALSRTSLLRWMEEATGRQGLVSVQGRLTQLRADTGDDRGWHDDLVESDKRRLALVINFSPARYDGGAFQLRWKGGERVFQHFYTEPGEAILFMVDPKLQHQVKPVTGGGPRRVYAGWALVEKGQLHP